MRRVRLGQQREKTEALAGEDPAPRRPFRRRAVFKGLAAFLLGLTIGVSGIIIAQTAITDEHDLAGRVLSPDLPLRR
jgi:hypothetical protein